MRICGRCGTSFEPKSGTHSGRGKFCGLVCSAAVGRAIRTERKDDPAIIERRFWESLIPEPNSGCWLWYKRPRAHRAERKQYGWVQIRGKDMFAHRAAWEIWRGPIPDGLQVLHKCDTPACCNPDHLFLGTHQVNMADRDAKGRHAIGERAGRAKLTEEKVREIRSKAARGPRALSREYGVDHKTIRTILSRETWRHI